MKPPAGMSESTWKAVLRLPPAQQVHVLERAALRHYDGGLTWAEADAAALAEEAPGQRSLFGGEP